MRLDSRDGKSSLHLPFSPVLYSTKISDDLHAFLMNETERVRNLQSNDASWGLAGKFINGQNKAFYWNDEDKQRFDSEITQCIASYMRWKYDIGQLTNITQHALFSSSFVQTKLGAWVNIQKAGDFNPIHDHDGDISLVIYLKVPQFSEEDEFRKGGYINWTYGEHNDMWIDTYTQKPIEKMLYIFPSKLKHYVWPMQSNDERISVACNYKVIKL